MHCFLNRGLHIWVSLYPICLWGISGFNRLIRLLDLVLLCPDCQIRLFQFNILTESGGQSYTKSNSLLNDWDQKYGHNLIRRKVFRSCCKIKYHKTTFTIGNNVDILTILILQQPWGNLEFLGKSLSPSVLQDHVKRFFHIDSFQRWNYGVCINFMHYI